MPNVETKVSIEAIRVPQHRESYGSLDDLGTSIVIEGLRHPVTLWNDGTLISGARRLRTHFILAGQPGQEQYRQINAVFVDNIQDAAKRLLIDNSDESCALPMKWSEVCRLWDVLRKLDEPAAAVRADEARRRGVELRRATQAGMRKAGRFQTHGEEFLMRILAEPFGISEATASRVRTIYVMANSLTVTPEAREKARQALDAIDSGVSSIWANYSALVSGRSAPAPVKPKAEAPVVEPAPAPRQVAAWNRSLPQLEGLAAGLAELGAPHPDLTWEQVGPVVARLSGVRRDLEKIIKAMKKETAQS